MGFTIKNTLLELDTTPWGASMTGLWLNNANGQRINVIYGYEEEDMYRVNIPFLGATCGRYAGRIAGHAFTINDIRYTLESDGEVHLHGGSHTLGRQKWTLKEIHEGKVPYIVYAIKSAHLEGGYPGNLEAEARFTLEENRVKISYSARSDKDTYLNLTNHNYYNLDGGGNVRSHRLMVNADTYLETDHLLIPTGKQIPVKGTALDHRKEKDLDNTFSEVIPDNTFALNRDRQAAASLYSPGSGILMKVFTDQPGLVVYTPEFLPETQYKNRPPGKYAAVCLEAQQFPNAPNEPGFPSALLKKGDTYRNEINLEFSIQ
ncbi:aldose epimerase family protein [Robertkochia sediminum]|uniref:aldose epimerase family protein n=1 Tax=Robertkochia sediminum TaxID=2785326 RepID=UPI00193331DF|nr:aldose epimerase family protein [Robertkochia sediminum]MBL7472631.1 galactose mutarotase [Robertkochia sediminum]